MQSSRWVKTQRGPNPIGDQCIYPCTLINFVKMGQSFASGGMVLWKAVSKQAT